MTILGCRAARSLSLPRGFELLPGAAGHVHGHQLCHPGGQVLERFRPQGSADPVFATELVDEDGYRAPFWLGEQQRRPTGLADPVGDLGDLQLGIHWSVDHRQPTAVAEQLDEVSEISHDCGPRLSARDRDRCAPERSGTPRESLRAELLQENRADWRRPSVRRVSASSGWVRSLMTQSSKLSSEVGLNRSAAEPVTSGREDEFETTEGVPQAMASSGGNPKPS